MTSPAELPSQHPGRAVVVTGVAGVGKSAVAERLAAGLGWTYLDADDDHSPAAVAKMRAGEPLSDADREPWLAAVRARLARHLARGEDVVLACSALRRAARDELATAGPRVVFVHLHAPEAVVRERLAGRRGHFAGPGLLASQLATLEPGDDLLTVDATPPLPEVVAAVRRRLGL